VVDGLIYRSFSILSLDLAGQELDAVLSRVNKYIFRNAIGLRPRTFNGVLIKLVRKCGLLTDGAGQRRTLYSLRHTYSTQELLSGTDIPLSNPARPDSTVPP